MLSPQSLTDPIHNNVADMPEQLVETKAWVLLHALGFSGRHRPQIMHMRAELPRVLSDYELVNGWVKSLRVRKWINSNGQMNDVDPQEYADAQKYAEQVHLYLGREAQQKRYVWGDPQTQPAWLLKMQSHPWLLYGRGNPEIAQQKLRVAIVGSRGASSSGLLRTQKIAAALAKAGAVVVSGGAIGVDLHAHTGALEAGGSTIVVLAEPAQFTASRKNKEFPARIQRLFAMDESRCLAISPHGPWVPLGPSLFVSRNRHIAALADAVVVIEGRLDSGTRHTAEAARRYGIPIWAIPGDIDNPLAAMPNALLEEGHARALIDVERFISIITGRKEKPAAFSSLSTPSTNLQLPLHARENTRENTQTDDLSPTAARVATLLRSQKQMDLQTLTQTLALSTGTLLQCAMELELAGLLCRRADALVWMAPV